MNSRCMFGVGGAVLTRRIRLSKGMAGRIIAQIGRENAKKGGIGYFNYSWAVHLFARWNAHSPRVERFR